MRYPYYDSFPEPGVRSVRVVRPWFARARSRFVNSGILQLSMESVVDELGAARSGVPAEFPLKFNRQVAGIQTSTVVEPRRCGIHHLFAQTLRVRVNECRRFAATNTSLRRPDVF